MGPTAARDDPRPKSHEVQELLKEFIITFQPIKIFLAIYFEFCTSTLVQ